MLFKDNVRFGSVWLDRLIGPYRLIVFVRCYREPRDSVYLRRDQCGSGARSDAGVQSGQFDRMYVRYAAPRIADAGRMEVGRMQVKSFIICSTCHLKQFNARSHIDPDTSPTGRQYCAPQRATHFRKLKIHRVTSKIDSNQFGSDCFFFSCKPMEH